MRCPDCEARLHADLVLETTSALRPVHTDHQWWRCTGCDARFFGVLIEDRTNIFNDDLDHAGYRPDRDAWERTMKRAQACPRPRDKRCDCAVHASPPAAYGARAW